MRLRYTPKMKDINEQRAEALGKEAAGLHQISHVAAMASFLTAISAEPNSSTLRTLSLLSGIACVGLGIIATSKDWRSQEILRRQSIEPKSPSPAL